MSPPTESNFLRFCEGITDVAQQLSNPITPREEQLVVIYQLFTSKKQLTLIELATGFGKSLMLSLLARCLDLSCSNKIVVVVPNEALAAIQ
jgi:superfamily II DNA or RNA helicase